MATSKTMLSIAFTGLLGLTASGLFGTGDSTGAGIERSPNAAPQPATQTDPGPAGPNEAARPLPMLQALGAAPAEGCEQSGAKEIDDKSASGLTIGRGDKIKLSFYEVLQSNDQKWGTEHKRYQEPARTFQAHAELSNEYVVQDDGSMVIPLLGRFVVEGRSSVDMQRKLECAFVAFLGRSGFVNVAGVVKPPVYVVGKVRNAGSYEFTPGMTVLHAIALAGGFEKTPMDPSRLAELTRETERLQLALDRAVRMMARTSAIEEVRTTGTMRVPSELADLAGKEKVRTLMTDEFALRKNEMQAVVADEASLKGVIESASSELRQRQARAPLVQQAIALRRDRVENLSKLATSGAIGRPVLLQAQTELLDAQERGQETQSLINQAQERFNRASRDLEARHEQATIAMQREAAEARRLAAEAAQEGDSSASLIKVIARSQLGGPTALETEFRIVRRTYNGVMQIPATGTTVLEPGDLIQTVSSAEQGVKN